MRIRSDGLVGAVCAASGFGVLIAVGGSVGSQVDASARAIGVVSAVALTALLVRVLFTGLTFEPWTTTVRDVLGTYRLERADVVGLAVERIARRRYQRMVVVCTDGRVIPASWTIAAVNNGEWVAHAAHVAQGFGETQAKVAETLQAHGRLEAEGQLPLATRDPGLTPETVRPVEDGAPRKWLGWETGFIVTAFALPGVAAAVTILAQHIGGVSDLDEFDLPLKHHPGVSLILLMFGYLTTALVVPIALLQLARSGQPPSSIGLERKGLGHDALSAVGLLAGSYALLLPIGLLLTLAGSGKFDNTASNTHVPAYFLLYGVLVSATTAINEEVIVNAYFLTRLSQMGWSRWPAFWLSFGVRESYHLYYGIGIFATMPIGYVLTRSFQKRGRIGRAIFTHFAFDVISFSIAVLTS